MAFLSFLDTNLAFFALGAYNLKFSGYAYGKPPLVDEYAFPPMGFAVVWLV